MYYKQKMMRNKKRRRMAEERQGFQAVRFRG